MFLERPSFRAFAVMAVLMASMRWTGAFLFGSTRYRSTIIRAPQVRIKLRAVTENVAPEASSASLEMPVALPRSVSPSSLADFKQCPMKYRYKYIERIPEPPQEALVRGNMIHTALEMLYEQDPQNRTVDTLHELFRKAFVQGRPKYAADLFPTLEQQREFGLEGLRLLENYYKLEDPRQKEPMHRELRMNLKLGEGGPNVTGIVDRVDEEDGDLMIIDYKSGKAPDLKYSMPVNERIVKEKFFQLKVYALLLDAQMNRLPSKLRLLFLTGPKGPEAYTLTLRPEEVLEAKQEVLDVWDKIVVACQTNDFPTKTGQKLRFFELQAMPYLRANWEGLNDRNGGGKFALNQVHSVDGVRLQRASRGGPRTCFVHVTLEQESRVSYVEAMVSAKSIDVYVLKGGASTDYVHVGTMQGKAAVDHPYKFHYRFEKEVLPDYRIALLQLRLTPHNETTQEMHLFKFSVLVGDMPGKQAREIPSFLMPPTAANGMNGRGVPMLTGGGPANGNMLTMGNEEMVGGAITTRTPHHQMTAVPGPEQQQLVRRGEGAVVAEALNDVMGRMLTVVSKKTQGYVGSTYRKTEDKIQARMKSIEEKISSFEQVVGNDIERRLINLEHIIKTLDDRIDHVGASPRPVATEGTA